MAIQSLPTNPVGVYWPNFGSVVRLSSYPDIVTDGSSGFNVMILFSAYPEEGGGGSTGAVTYIQGGMSADAWNNRVADIATIRARGQIVLLSVGGAGRQVYVTSQARADALVDSLITIISSLGEIDGIDWNNFELGGSDPVYMTYASLRLKDHYGSGFLITAPPAAFALSAPPAQGGSDRLMMATMHRGGTYGNYTGSALDWVCPQHYDGINQVANIRNSLNFYDDTITVDASALLGTASASVAIPSSKLGVGFGMQTPQLLSQYGQAVYDGYWTPANAISAYTTIKSERGTLRGAFNWSAHLDLTDIFPANLGPTINPEAGGGGGNTTLTTVKKINGLLVVAVKKINGILVSAVKSWNGKQ